MNNRNFLTGSLILVMVLTVFGCAQPVEDEPSASKTLVISGMNAYNGEIGVVWVSSELGGKFIAAGQENIASGLLTVPLKTAKESGDPTTTAWTGTGAFYVTFVVMSGAAPAAFVYKEKQPDSDFDTKDNIKANAPKLNFTETRTSADLSDFANISASWPLY